MTLRVIVQIVPHGDESQVREIGRLNISNMLGSYPEQWDGTCAYKVVEEDGTEWIEYVMHKRGDGFWNLIKAVLNSMPIDILRNLSRPG